MSTASRRIELPAVPESMSISISRDLQDSKYTSIDLRYPKLSLPGILYMTQEIQRLGISPIVTCTPSDGAETIAVHFSLKPMTRDFRDYFNAISAIHGDGFTIHTHISKNSELYLKASTDFDTSKGDSWNLANLYRRQKRIVVQITTPAQAPNGFHVLWSSEVYEVKYDTPVSQCA